MVPVIAAGAALLTGGTTVGAAAGAAVAGAAAVAGGIAAKKALGGNTENGEMVREVTVRTVPESEVPAHIRKKIEEKSRKMR